MLHNHLRFSEVSYISLCPLLYYVSGEHTFSLFSVSLHRDILPPLVSKGPHLITPGSMKHRPSSLTTPFVSFHLSGTGDVNSYTIFQ